MHRLQHKPGAPAGLLSQCREPSHADTSTEFEKQRKRKPAAKQRTKIRGPMLARVVIQNSSKPPQIAMVKPGDGRKSKASSSGVSSRADSAVHLAASTPSLPPYDEAVEDRRRSAANRSNTIPEEHPEYGANPVSAPLEPRTSRPSQSTSRLHAAQPKQLINPNISRTTAPLPANELKRPKKEYEKHYSFVSGSTKLGEIPLHKWPEPFDFDAMSLMNKDAEKNGWPVTQKGGDDHISKRRFGIFRLFRRKPEVT